MIAIAAVCENGGIGREGALLFHIREDLRRFRQLTLGKTVVMGRRTLESLPGGRGLPDRRNLVLTRDPDFTAPGAEVIHDLAEVPEETLYFFYYEYPPADQPLIQALPKSKALALADRPADDYPSFNGSDWYLVDKDFSWTYVHTHEEMCGPYFCRAADGR